MTPRTLPATREKTPSSALQPGFADPVFDAQKVFRAALAAMSEPGAARRLAVGRSIAGAQSATYALLLTLADTQTPVWLSPRLDHPVLRANLAFHCHCPITPSRAEAHLAVLEGAEAGDLREFCRGDPQRPDRSCTLILQLSDFAGGAPRHWRGPGILHERRVCLPIDDAFWAARAQRNAFPLGLDFFFTADDQLMGLPRTTQTQGVDERIPPEAPSEFIHVIREEHP
jgi:alpha-D-ribose 1-methylphosphonate 5-triphosphate synthase subunit PhnH